MAPSPQFGLYLFGQSARHRQAAQLGAVLAKGTDEMRGREARGLECFLGTHEMLHRGHRRTLTTKQVRETEAEAVAFVVGSAIGLQTGTASADYIQLWHGDANLLRESLEAVQQTATVILGAIAPKPEIALEMVSAEGIESA